ncbi:MAG: hypothetical protein AABX85_01865 [Nanoarchaeota archaeon]
MTFKQFIKELNGNRVEGELVKTIFYSLLTSFVFLVVIYYTKLMTVENLVQKYGLFLLLSALTYAIITPAIRQVRAYKELPCMSGMMIGMTIGMISGFMPGFLLGATNGMFVGTVFGMIVGITFGVWNGKSCGIMGTMEGIMAGFMGGIMGAMTAVMLLNDHLMAISIIIFIVSAVIMFSLNFMIYRETKESQKQIEEDHLFTIILTFTLMAATTWLMIFGPRSFLFGG